MKEYFVTFFNKVYLPQGLSLCESLNKVYSEFTLFIFCMDEETYKILKNLKIKNIELKKISNFETSQLNLLKKERTIAEYCWTLTPHVIEWIFKENVHINRLTYLDADLFFFKSPRPIFDEFLNSNKSVLITKHAFSPSSDYSHISGHYVVQFISFKRDFGLEILLEWKNKCINWCFDWYEDGKYGDQKYLEEWPIKYYESVHVLNMEHYAMGPWNIDRFPYSDCIFFHFHGLKLLSKKNIFLGNYEIPIKPYNFIYKVYSNSLKRSINLLEKSNFKIIRQIKLRRIIKLIVKRNLSSFLNFLKVKLNYTSFIRIFD